MKYMIECVRDGKEIDTDWCKGINEGAVELTAINDKVAAPGTAEAIKAAEEQFKAGTLHVFDTSTFTVGGKVLTSYKADVDTDENYTPTPRLFPTVTSTSLRSVPLLTSMLTSMASLFSTNN